jgi:hypothetical protein
MEGLRDTIGKVKVEIEVHCPHFSGRTCTWTRLREATESHEGKSAIRHVAKPCRLRFLGMVPPPVPANREVTARLPQHFYCCERCATDKANII